MHRLNPNAPVFVPRHLQVEPTSIPVALEEHPSPGIVSTDVSPSTSSVPPGTSIHTMQACVMLKNLVPQCNMHNVQQNFIIIINPSMNVLPT